MFKFQNQYRIKEEIRRGTLYFVPQMKHPIKTFLFWMDCTVSSYAGAITIRKNTHEEAEEWIRNEIIHNAKMNENKVLGYTNYHTRQEKIKLLNKNEI